MKRTRAELLKAAAGSLALYAMPAFSATPLKLALPCPLTGPNAGAGKCFCWHEKSGGTTSMPRGGLLGRPVEFVYYDDKATLHRYLEFTIQIDRFDRVDLVVSPYGTNQIAPRDADRHREKWSSRRFWAPGQRYF